MKTHHSNEKTHDEDKDEDEDVDDVHENNTEVYSEFVFPPRAWIQVVWLNSDFGKYGPRSGEGEDFQPRTSEGNSRIMAGAQISAAGAQLFILSQ